MNTTYIKIEYYSHHTTIYASGDWTIRNVSDIDRLLKSFSCYHRLVWDFSAVSSFDSSGILLFINYYKRFRSDCEVEVVGYTQDQERMYHLLLKHKIDDVIPQTDRGILYNIGKSVVSSYSVFMKFLDFTGYLLVAFLRYFIHPQNIRIKEIVYYIERSGVGALFIIALTSSLVGMVISYQSAVELSKFGADIFIVDLAGISITRELAPLITAIVVAGRSGSAYTAQIGAMKITEEISAMRTMGFDPYYFLILPRMIYGYSR